MIENTATTGEETPQVSEWRRNKRSAIVWIFVATFVEGLYFAVYHRDPLVEFVFAMVTARQCYLWCLYDSQLRNYVVNKNLWPLIIFLTPIGLSIYLLKTRGRRGLISIAKSAGLSVALIVTLILGEFVMTILLLIRNGQ